MALQLKIFEDLSMSFLWVTQTMKVLPSKLIQNLVISLIIGNEEGKTTSLID